MLAAGQARQYFAHARSVHYVALLFEQFQRTVIPTTSLVELAGLPVDVAAILRGQCLLIQEVGATALYVPSALFDPAPGFVDSPARAAT